MTTYTNDAQAIQEIISRVGNDIVLATPLAAGKPNYFLNEIYRYAKEHQEIHLDICTTLTLQKPKGKSDLEKRFIQLFNDRIFGDYPDLLYEDDRMSQCLPGNIRVLEFYFAPGKYLHTPSAQQNYISSNYTHVARDMYDRNVNVIAQMVSKKEIDGKIYFSFGSNPDVTDDLIQMLREDNIPFVSLAQVNQQMPFMYGDAMVEEDYFDMVIDNEKQYFQLFGPPKTSIADADYMIGLYCSALVIDDGELQIGIGALGDATIYNLILKHNRNEDYLDLIKEVQLIEKFPEAMERIGYTGKYEKGLFGGSEMIVDGFMYLYQNNIVRKKVYDDIALQRLINDGQIKEEFDDNILEIMWRNGIINERMTEEDCNYLKYWGIIKEEVAFKDGHISLNGRTETIPYLSDPADYNYIVKNCLGNKLKNGQVMHGGFFLGPQRFYQWLRSLPKEEIKQINMKSVQKINHLYGHEDIDRLHRKNARFINSCMMYTLSGAAVSDGLSDGNVVSGVGGQYNFVAMAHELPDGHSILNLRSTRSTGKSLISNIIPNYGHITIPRHLRDIVVTEYGIAFLRGKTDEEVIQELLKVSDSRFQNDLLVWAKEAGKLSRDYVIPNKFRNNYPDSYQAIIRKFRKRNMFSPFPYGTDLTDDEIRLGRALKGLKGDLGSKGKLLKTIWKSLFVKPGEEDLHLLSKMDLHPPKSWKERLYKNLIAVKLEKQ